MISTNDKLSGEDRLIARFFAPIATHPGALALSDDAAFLTPPPGCDLVLKTDAIIGGGVRKAASSDKASAPGWVAIG